MDLRKTGTGLTLGAGLGIIFGAAFGEPGVGLVIGAALGVVFGRLRSRPR